MVVKKSLQVSKNELAEVLIKLKSLRMDIYSKLRILEKCKLQALIKLNCQKQASEVQIVHNKKLLNLWFRQRPRSPNCILNLSERTLTLEEKNVLYGGLKHHILPKCVNEQKVKVEVEKLFRNLKI